MNVGRVISTADKFLEKCPECGTLSPAQDKVVKLYDFLGTYPMRQWSYECGECQWTWVNEVQRQNNERFFKKANKARREYLLENGVSVYST